MLFGCSVVLQEKADGEEPGSSLQALLDGKGAELGLVWIFSPVILRASCTLTSCALLFLLQSARTDAAAVLEVWNSMALAVLFCFVLFYNTAVLRAEVKARGAGLRDGGGAEKWGWDLSGKKWKKQEPSVAT